MTCRSMQELNHSSADAADVGLKKGARPGHRARPYIIGPIKNY
jgi:hypothetical protein